MWCYSRILAHYPYVVIGVVSLFSATCLIMNFTISYKPDFSDPKAGFEPWGTEVARRYRSWELLIDSTSTDGSLSAAAFYDPLTGKKNNKDEDGFFAIENEFQNTSKKLQPSSQAEENVQEKTTYFCDEMPRKEFSRVVFQSTAEKSLFTVSSIHSMCRQEISVIRSHPQFDEQCFRRASSPSSKTEASECCQSWSLGNYVAQLSNKSSCYEVDQGDLDFTLSLLMNCSTFYHNSTLTASCGTEYSDYYQNSHSDGEKSKHKCQNIPDYCKRHSSVYNILHYITDEQFLKHDKNGLLDTHLTYSAIFLPLARSSSLVELYKGMEQHGLSNGETEIIGVEFGLKHELFDYYLLMDMIWIGAAVAVIFLFMWLYTASFFISIMSFLSVGLTLIISYFLYTLVFEIKFFPFMNQLTLVIIIGIGADDIFIYCKIWSLSKSEKNNGTLEKIISDTLKHAVLSMFVTSLTTAAAFYANYLSSITSLSCFAIFSGTAVMINFILMITWIPATIVIHEKWCCESCDCYSPDAYVGKRHILHYICKFPYKFYHCMDEWARIFFEKILPCIVIKLRYLWLLIFGSLGVFGLLVIFYYPKLHLPTSDQFQMFSSNHPFEMYDFKIKNKFWFEKAQGISVPMLPLTIVWGVHPTDNREKLNPYSRGQLEYDVEFDIATPRAQQWLLRFCRRLRGTKFYQSTPGIQLTNCFIEHFKRFMERGCTGVRGESYAPCCKSSKFPYQKNIFTKCLEEWIPDLARSRLIYGNNQLAGPRFSKETGELVGIIVEFYSNVPYTLNYNTVDRFYSYMNEWVGDELFQAPKELQRGWFISEVQFFGLQDSIAKGTPVAIAVSISVATVIAFLTTLNILISFYAILTISCAIFVTVAATVLLGWELNILESVTISIAVGLSIDFSLHYGVAYRLSPDLDREMRVICSIGRMGTAIAMAAFTTFLAGAFMMPSTVLAYRQLGTFLMLIMSISWVYSTFFLQSLLRTLGPQGGFGQFHWPSWDCCITSGREHVDKTVYALSESTLSSSSTSNPNYHPSCSSETHELEPLTEKEVQVKSTKVTKLPPSRQLSNNNTLSDLKREPVIRIQSSPPRRHPPHPHIYKTPTNFAANGQSARLLLEEEGERDHVILIQQAPSETEIWVKRPEFL